MLRHGDLSVLSFHATKVFNTFEGGAIVCHNIEMKERIDHLKNFGIVDEVTVIESGINGKMSELNAAFGLLQLKHVNSALSRRKEIALAYRSKLCNVEGIYCLNGNSTALINNSYFPILVRDEYPYSRDDLYLRLREKNVHARRYFYPLISDLPMYRNLRSARRDNLPIAASAASQVLCLPIYPALTDEDVARVASIISEC